MSWVISLILLAVAAYFIISALKSKNQYDVKNQASDGEVDEAAQLSSDATSADAFQNAGGAPAGSGSGNNASAASNGGSSGGVAGLVTAGATTAAATTAGAIASAREYNLKGVAGNSVGEIQEMLKILNLRDSDAGRLAIERDQYAALKDGTSQLGANELASVADKLRWMLR